MSILGISGSLRRDSLNTGLLRAAASELPDDVELEIWDGLREIPPYDEDLDSEQPAAVTRLKEAIAAADAVLIATPEYNHSIPGHLKNALDWVSRPLVTSPLRNTPVAVVGASTGAFGAVWAQDDLRRVLGAIGARVVGEPLPVPRAHTSFDPSGELVDDALRRQLRGVVGSLVAETGAILVAA